MSELDAVARAIDASKQSLEALLLGLPGADPKDAKDRRHRAELGLQRLRKDIAAYRRLVADANPPMQRSEHERRLKAYQTDLEHCAELLHPAEGPGVDGTSGRPTAIIAAGGGSLGQSRDVLAKASALQDDSLASLERTAAMAANCQALATKTALQLRQQGETLDRVQADEQLLESHTKVAKKKLRSLGRWFA